MKLFYVHFGEGCASDGMAFSFIRGKLLICEVGEIGYYAGDERR